ncbi:MAG: DUF6484 domain-containing protein [Reinekea sp.]
MNEPTNSDSSTGTKEVSVSPGYKIAKLVSTDDSSTVMVQWGSHSPTPARHLSNIDLSELLGTVNSGKEVMITFIDNDVKQPVITGVMASVVGDMVQGASEAGNKAVTKVIRDGESIIISANEQITLTCGKSSLILREDGKIVTKGDNILSRASATHKIKGCKVEVN